MRTTGISLVSLALLVITGCQTAGSGAKEGVSMSRPQVARAGSASPAVKAPESEEATIATLAGGSPWYCDWSHTKASSSGTFVLAFSDDGGSLSGSVDDFTMNAAIRRAAEIRKKAVGPIEVLKVGVGSVRYSTRSGAVHVMTFADGKVRDEAFNNRNIPVTTATCAPSIDTTADKT